MNSAVSGPADAAVSIAGKLLELPQIDRRRVVAIAGPPGSGKTSIAQELAAVLTANSSPAVHAPMDGFHLDNTILRARNMMNRKGAPETFDLVGFIAMVSRLPTRRAVIWPQFDRKLDMSISGRIEIPESADWVVVEGNYLLFDADGWSDLSKIWDYAVFLEVPLDILEERLIKRWLDYGLSIEEARERAQSNDLTNANRILSERLAADLVLESGR